MAFRHISTYFNHIASASADLPTLKRLEQQHDKWCDGVHGAFQAMQDPFLFFCSAADIRFTQCLAENLSEQILISFGLYDVWLKSNYGWNSLIDLKNPLVVVWLTFATIYIVILLPNIAKMDEVEQTRSFATSSWAFGAWPPNRAPPQLPRLVQAPSMLPKTSALLQGAHPGQRRSRRRARVPKLHGWTLPTADTSAAHAFGRRVGATQVPFESKRCLERLESAGRFYF